MSEAVDEILAQDRATATPFTIKKLEQSAAANWDRFYKTHEANFFKDRHWTDLEFSLLKSGKERANTDGIGLEEAATSLHSQTGETETLRSTVLLEVGCGVGNMLYPLIEKDEHLKVHCCDFSPRAISLVRKHPSYSEGRVNAFVHDLAKSGSLVRPLALHPFGLPTIISLIFVLSAVPPVDHDTVMQSLAETLASGGSLIFRDYARGDMAQMRFHTSPQKRATKSWTEPSLLSPDLDYYRRGDNTLTYFFTESYLSELARQAGLVGDIVIVEKTVKNRKDDLEMKRRFIQARWQKTSVPCDTRRPSPQAEGTMSSSTSLS